MSLIVDLKSASVDAYTRFPAGKGCSLELKALREDSAMLWSDSKDTTPQPGIRLLKVSPQVDGERVAGDGVLGMFWWCGFW
ncbi:MAG: hypothetical protein AB1486_32865 [Planctomycetota bacterium]